ncbi:MAG: hypothetical protein VXZ38_06935 [Planctomycetota bacterium]|nr:hypothetical protein [Planctomycetota bacterium]
MSIFVAVTLFLAQHVLTCVLIAQDAVPAGRQGSVTDSPEKLSHRLMQEGYGALAKAARDRGNPVQGSIYFADSRSKCAECHLRGTVTSNNDQESFRLGPNLSLLKADVSDSDLVRSLLDPSAEIAEEFKTRQILTVDGNQYNGRFIKEQKGDVVIQQLLPPYRLIRIPKESIADQKISNQSAMPSELMDTLRDRQAFLDLVSYLYQLRGSAAEPNQKSTRVVDSMQSSERILGLALVDEYRCARCHNTDPSEQFSALAHTNPVGPDLKNVTKRADPAYLARFIAKPHDMKPGTMMPDHMAWMSEKKRDQVAGLILTFLDSLSEDLPREDNGKIGITDSKAIQRGDELFHSVGCVACHGPQMRMSVDPLRHQVGESSNQGLSSVNPSHFVSLGDIPFKYHQETLTQFLENPLQSRPSGRMPNLNLTHWEAQDIAAYLMSSQQESVNDAGERPLPGKESASSATQSKLTDQSDVNLRNSGWQSDERVEAGKRWFTELNCVRCHEVGGLPVMGEFTAFSNLDPESGCLSENLTPSKGMPSYRFTQGQLAALRRAVVDSADLISESDKIHWAMKSMRCAACHERDGIGGVDPSIDIFFKTTNQNLGPQGRLPPSLTLIGAKLNPNWLRQVLVEARSVRPYMSTRMPRFGLKNVQHFLDAFYKVDAKMLDAMVELPDDKDTRNAATEMIGQNGLNCIACHTFQNKGQGAMPALDLTVMAERLQPGWFYQYMLSPQAISPNTVMPSFWPGGRAIRKDLMNGTTESQITAVWSYLKRGRQAPTPRGLQLEPLQLLADGDEAVMLRRSYPNIGKRGIGVGYPLGINLAFDAEQMRLGLMWKGDFVDPGGVWRGQGHGRVRPLSSDVWQLHAGPDFDSRDRPWVPDDGRPPDHQFGGYFLDDDQRPTFLYRYGNLEVQDYFVDRVSFEEKENEGASVALHRYVKLKSAGQSAGLRFRVASGREIIPLQDSKYLVNQNVIVSIPDAMQAVVVAVEEQVALYLHLDQWEGEQNLEVSYVW